MRTKKEGTMFYIYEKSSTYIIGKPDSKGVARPNHSQVYKTMAAAKAGLTRIKKAENLLPTDPNYADFRYAIAEANHFHQKIEKSVKKKNLLRLQKTIHKIHQMKINNKISYKVK